MNEPCIEPFKAHHRLLSMRKIIAIITCGLLQNICVAQQVDLAGYNKQAQQINKNGLLVLGSWSAANVIYGSIASSQTSGSTKYFHQMNALWNGITLGLSSAGYLLARKETGLSFEETLKKQAGVEKLFLFNAGLDVAYITGGLYLKERSKNSINNRDKLKGYGESVMLQGSALLLFDVIMYAINNKHGKQLYLGNKNVSLNFTGNGVGLAVGVR